MDVKKSMISFYKPFHLYLRKLSRKQTLKKTQSLPTGLILCVDCYVWAKLGMLVLCTWVCGFAIMILAKVLQSTVQGRAWECGSCMLFMLYFKEEIHSPNIDDVELKRLENNHNKRKHKKKHMLVLLPLVLFL